MNENVPLPTETHRDVTLNVKGVFLSSHFNLNSTVAERRAPSAQRSCKGAAEVRYLPA